MLENRHGMSSLVRKEVTVKSQEWGYQVGSIYIRKVHFRDRGMTSQIEQKVVNRLRQVTAAIQQDGSNRVNVIRSTAERQAAVEFAKAAATRPQIVGRTLGQIAENPMISNALFEVLETQALLASPGLETSVLAQGVPLILALGSATPPLRQP
jgi:regulator of protease activity HflC (stomatin/prohibitin superfamily)